jgi:hypothetical protein
MRRNASRLNSQKLQPNLMLSRVNWRNINNSMQNSNRRLKRTHKKRRNQRNCTKIKWGSWKTSWFSINRKIKNSCEIRLRLHKNVRCCRRNAANYRRNWGKNRLKCRSTRDRPVILGKNCWRNRELGRKKSDI